MTFSNGNGNGNGSKLYSVLVPVVIAVVSASFGAIGTYYKDQIVTSGTYREWIHSAFDEERQLRKEDLTHYLTREEFLKRMEVETAKRSAEFYELKLLILQGRKK